MLLLAAALPLLFWDAGPSTAGALRDAHIGRIAVPAAQMEAWKSVGGISVEAASTAGLDQAGHPRGGIPARPGDRQPGAVDSVQRLAAPAQAGSRFYYDAPGPAAGLAAAEAFAYGAQALVHTDAAGVKPFAGMLAFLSGLEKFDFPPLADIAFQDDGSETAGEVLNLMLRNNLLVLPVARADAKAKLNVRLGTSQFPLETAQDPAAMAHLVRSTLGDDRRSLRMFGTQVVLARVTSNGARMRVALLNYDGARRKVDGLHIRILGRFSHPTAAAPGGPISLTDYTADDQATEFTLPELVSFALIDLSR